MWFAWIECCKEWTMSPQVVQTGKAGRRSCITHKATKARRPNAQRFNWCSVGKGASESTKITSWGALITNHLIARNWLEKWKKPYGYRAWFYTETWVTLITKGYQGQSNPGDSRSTFHKISGWISWLDNMVSWICSSQKVLAGIAKVMAVFSSAIMNWCNLR